MLTIGLFMSLGLTAYAGYRFAGGLGQGRTMRRFARKLRKATKGSLDISA